MPATLFVVNEPPYGTERAYNALRVARALLDREGESVQMFLIGDGVSNAVQAQELPHGYYNIETMLLAVIKRGAQIGSARPAWMRVGWKMLISLRAATEVQ
jgi:uncharacterized protein involved in oxidation of intracellular sulfur